MTELQAADIIDLLYLHLCLLGWIAVLLSSSYFKK